MINKKFNLKQILIKYPYLTIGFFVTIFFIVCAYFLPIQFEENDDITMLLLASGKYSGTPDAHLFNINYLLGLLICFCYSITQKIEWYSVFFSAIHIISISVILKYFLVDKSDSIVFKLLITFIILLFEVFFITNFQFTTTSTLACMAAVLLLLEYNKLYSFLWGLVLLCIGIMIRKESSLLVIVLSMPIFLMYIVNKKKSFLVIIYIFFIYISCISINFFAFKNKTWENFYLYRNEKASIIDSPRSQLLDQNTKINSSELFLFLSNLYDPNIYSLEKIKEINAEINNKTINIITHGLIENFKSFVIGNYNKYLPPAQCFMYFLLIFFFRNENRWNKFILGLVLTSFILINCYIPIYLTFKLRAFFSSIFIVFVLFSIFFKSPSSYLFKWITIYVFFVFASYVYRNVNNTRKYNRIKKECYNKQKKLIDNYNGTILPNSGAFVIEGISPFSVSQNIETQKIYSMAFVESPLNKHKCNSFKELVNGPAIFMGNSSLQSIPKMLIQSIERHYHIKAKYRIIAQDSSNTIVQFYK